MSVREVYADIAISQRLLFISSLLVIKLAAFLVLGIFCVSVFFALWQRNQQIEKYFASLIREVNQEEIFIEKARNFSEKILHDADTNSPLVIHVLKSFVPALRAASAKKSVPMAGVPWLTPAVAIKFGPFSEIELDRLALLAVRFMVFDEGYWGEERLDKDSFLITPDANFASFRRQVMAPGLSNDEALQHTASMVLGNIDRAMTTSRLLLKEARWTERYTHPLTGKTVLSYFAPVYDTAGKLAFYIGTDVDPITFLDNNHTAMLPEGEIVQLVNMNGNVIAWTGDASLNTTKKSMRFSMPFLNQSAMTVDMAAGTIAFERDISSIGWRAVYSVKMYKMLSGQMPLIVLLVLLLGVFTMVVFYGNRFVRRHVITPALQRAIALRESEEFAYGVLRTAPVGLAVIDPSGPSLRVSNPVYDRGIDLIATFGVTGLMNLQRQLSTGASGQLITGFVRGAPVGQSERFYSITTTQQTLYKKDVLIFAVSDITAQKQSEAELLVSRNAIAAANQAKDVFLATVSHEIRTPLYGTLASLELLARTSLNEAQHYYVDVMQSSTRNLLELMNGLLDFSKIEADKLTLVHRAVYLIPELEEVGRAFATRARLQGLTFDWMIDPALSQAVMTDSVRLTQVITNLIGNAIKFTSNGYVAFSARLASSSETHCKLVLCIEDSGIGIAPSKHDNLFQPFSQLNQGETHISGTGLGLSISKNIVALLNGTIQVDSEEGKGAIFTVTLHLPWANPPSFCVSSDDYFLYHTNIARREWYLRSLIQQAGYTPLAIAESESNVTSSTGILCFADETISVSSIKRAVLIDPHVPESTTERTCQTTLSIYVSAFRQEMILDRIKSEILICPLNQSRSLTHTSSQYQLYVLAVDDHFINGTILAHQLETLGCMVDIYRDPQEALDAFDPESHQLVFTDVNMPGMSGQQFAAHIKKVAATIPIIGVTADVKLDVSQIRAFDMMLTKPLSVPQLDAAIQKLDADGMFLKRMFSSRKSHTVVADVIGTHQLSDSMRKKMVTITDLDLKVCAVAIKSLKLRETEELAHRMRGAFLATGFPDIAMLCTDLELAVSSGTIDLLPKLLGKISDEWRVVRASFLFASDA